MVKENDNILEFKNYQYQLSIPFVIFADFETILRNENIANPSTSSVTEKINQHEVCGYSYVIVGPDGKSVKPVVVYRGVNAVDRFLEDILTEEKELVKINYYSSIVYDSAR
ncbi:hypothetical protein JTE90_016446 [Oedothorax gibbosus]|uniref:Uncharacterized protein n=1 Tax=Oedothorax gibbosus TaxID=931172 RepID=A0AAV6V7N5_9ARAC|nr:hypothetical protein JTE90_016446 [Oedothorax gibbosus]